MIISENKVVSLHYILRIGDENGELIEETYGSDPLQYIQGVGMMISGFEKNLTGKSVGEKYNFILSPSEAYGEINEDDIVTVPIENFADTSGKVDRSQLEVGSPIYMTDDHGHQFTGMIREIKLDTVVVDFNHPMAGQQLHFSGEITEVRDATASELDHGHVHGPGGHHH